MLRISFLKQKPHSNQPANCLSTQQIHMTNLNRMQKIPSQIKDYFTPETLLSKGQCDSTFDLTRLWILLMRFCVNDCQWLHV